VFLSRTLNWKQLLRQRASSAFLSSPCWLSLASLWGESRWNEEDAA
jgi:hypothetical protein